MQRSLLYENFGYFESVYKTPIAKATATATSNMFAIDDVPEPAVKSSVMWLYTGKVCLDPGNLESLEDHLHLET